MLTIGLVYVSLSITLKIWVNMQDLKNNKVPNRMSNYFLIVGIFNILASVAKFTFLQEYKLLIELLAVVSVLVFGVLCLREIRKLHKELDARIKFLLDDEEEDHDLGNK